MPHFLVWVVVVVVVMVVTVVRCLICYGEILDELLSRLEFLDPLLLKPEIFEDCDDNCRL